MKTNFNVLSRYKIWLKQTAKHYKVTESEIVRGCRKPEVITARQTFYWLCWRDRINLTRLSTRLGKDRTTVMATMNQGWKNRERNVENKIYEKITSKKSISKKEAEVITGEGVLCSNVAISGRLVFISTPRG